MGSSCSNTNDSSAWHFFSSSITSKQSRYPTTHRSARAACYTTSIKHIKQKYVQSFIGEQSCHLKPLTKGILALREQAQQVCNPEEGAVYVPLMGKHFPASEVVTDLNTMIQAFTAVSNPKRTCVLLGNGGSGKSLFLQQLTLKLWHEYKAGKPIPLFVSLPLLQDPIHSAVEETFIKNRV